MTQTYRMVPREALARGELDVGELVYPETEEDLERLVADPFRVPVRQVPSDEVARNLMTLADIERRRREDAEEDARRAVEEERKRRARFVADVLARSNPVRRAIRRVVRADRPASVTATLSQQVDLPSPWELIRDDCWWNGARRPEQKIYRTAGDNGDPDSYVISESGCWMPGSYASATTALRAFDLTEQERSNLQETVNRTLQRDISDADIDAIVGR